MEKMPAELQIDALFGMVESMSVMISALIAHNADRDGLEAHMDFRLGPARVAVLNAARSDATLEAFDGMTAAFKALIENEFEGWDRSSRVFAELSGRLRRADE